MTTQHIRYTFALILTALVLFAPLFVFAAVEGRLNSPLDPQYSDWKGLLSGLLKIMVILAIPIIVLAIVYSGAKLVISANTGKGKGIEEAKSGIKWTLIGSGLILAAWVIANIIGGTVGQVLGS